MPLKKSQEINNPTQMTKPNRVSSPLVCLSSKAPLCLLKTPKGQESLEIFAPQPSDSLLPR
jgi:hypothetical protein